MFSRNAGLKKTAKKMLKAPPSEPLTPSYICPPI